MTPMELQAKIRDIPDFPEKGIVFKDITPLLRDAKAFQTAIEALAQPFVGRAIGAVVAIEARGFILGAPIASQLGVGFVPVRKLGKLPWQTYSVEYSLEYGFATMEMHRDGVLNGERVLIVDDVLATGGTLAATAQLVAQSGAQIVAMAVLMELEALGGRQRLQGHELFSLLRS